MSTEQFMERILGLSMSGTGHKIFAVLHPGGAVLRRFLGRVQIGSIVLTRGHILELVQGIRSGVTETALVVEGQKENIFARFDRTGDSVEVIVYDENATIRVPGDGLLELERQTRTVANHQLAALLHEMWGDWVRAFLSQTHEDNESYAVIVPAHLWKRWIALANTPYDKLEEPNRVFPGNMAVRVQQLFFGTDDSESAREVCPDCGGAGMDPGPAPFDQSTAAVCPTCLGGDGPTEPAVAEDATQAMVLAAGEVLDQPALRDDPNALVGELEEPEDLSEELRRAKGELGYRNLLEDLCNGTWTTAPTMKGGKKT